MEEQNRETPDERNRKEELCRVIEKIGNTPIRNNEDQQGTSRYETTSEPKTQSKETMSTDSNDSLEVPAIKFK